VLEANEYNIKIYLALRFPAVLPGGVFNFGGNPAISSLEANVAL